MNKALSVSLSAAKMQKWLCLPFTILLSDRSTHV